MVKKSKQQQPEKKQEEPEKKWSFETRTDITHVQLRQKLIVTKALYAISGIDFAGKMALALVPKKESNYDNVVIDYKNSLYERISKTKSWIDKSNPTTLSLIAGCAKLSFEEIHDISEPSKFAQISINEWVSLLHEADQDILFDKINEVSANNELKNIGRELGVLTQGKKNMSSRKSTDIHDDLLPVYTNLGQFRQSFDSDEHDLSEIQKFMYFDSSAVSHWATLIASADKNYPNYLNCKSALDTFLSHDYWKDLLKNKQISRTINLGAGTPEKDRAIINSSIEQKEKNTDIALPTHYIIDSSMYMLLNTVKKLCYSNTHSRKMNDNDIISVAGDFMTLSKLIPCCSSNNQKSPRRSAFFLLGGTIGNINPRRFIESVNSVAASGDILIISAEFRPDMHENIDQFQCVTTSHYNHKNAKQLVVPAARSVLKSRKYAHLNSHMETDEIIISRLTATSSNVSHAGRQLPNSLKIVFKYEHGDTAFNVVEASRYIEKEFIEFITGEGFSYINSFGKNYPKQIVFEKL